MLCLNHPQQAHFHSIISHPPLHQIKKVSSNMCEFKENIMRDIETLNKNSIDISKDIVEKLKSSILMAVDKSELANMQDIVSLDEQYEFEDLRTRNKTTVDIARCIILAKEITRIKGAKSTSFECDAVVSGNLTTTPLTPEDYQQGAPFLLSCKTKHCDFPGAAGGNYPLAEYLSDDGLSVKIINQLYGYIGHFNVWKLESGDFCIGTVAMKNDSKHSVFSPKNLKHLLLSQAVNLLENNSGAQRVLLGMGGHNIKNIYPDNFHQHSKNFGVLGRLRHEKPQFFSQKDVETLEKTTGMQVCNTNIIISNQEAIGMQEDQRKDFKNALVLLERNNDMASDRDGIAQAKRIIKNYDDNFQLTDAQQFNRELRMKEAFIQKQIRSEFWETMKNKN